MFMCMCMCTYIYICTHHIYIYDMTLSYVFMHTMLAHDSGSLHDVMVKKGISFVSISTNDSLED